MQWLHSTSSPFGSRILWPPSPFLIVRERRQMRLIFPSFSFTTPPLTSLDLSARKERVRNIFLTSYSYCKGFSPAKPVYVHATRQSHMMHPAAQSSRIHILVLSHPVFGVATTGSKTRVTTLFFSQKEAASATLRNLEGHTGWTSRFVVVLAPLRNPCHVAPRKSPPQHSRPPFFSGR